MLKQVIEKYFGNISKQIFKTGQKEQLLFMKYFYTVSYMVVIPSSYFENLIVLSS